MKSVDASAAGPAAWRKGFALFLFSTATGLALAAVIGYGLASAVAIILLVIGNVVLIRGRRKNQDGAYRLGLGLGGAAFCQGGAAFVVQTLGWHVWGPVPGHAMSPVSGTVVAALSLVMGMGGFFSATGALPGRRGFPGHEVSPGEIRRP